MNWDHLFFFFFFFGRGGERERGYFENNEKLSHQTFEWPCIAHKQHTTVPAYIINTGIHINLNIYIYIYSGTYIQRNSVWVNFLFFL